MFDNWQSWLRALIAAVVSGFAHGVAAVLPASLIAPGAFNAQSASGVGNLLLLAGTAGLIGGVISATTYLMQSPVPADVTVVVVPPKESK